MPSWYLHSPIYFSPPQSFFVGAEAQLHTRHSTVVKALPALPSQTLYFFSLFFNLGLLFPLIQKQIALSWKHGKRHHSCSIFTHQLLPYFALWKKCTLTWFQLIRTLSEADSGHVYSLYTTAFAISSWASGLKAAWICTRAWKPGRSRMLKWPTFLFTIS